MTSYTLAQRDSVWRKFAVVIIMHAVVKVHAIFSLSLARIPSITLP